VRWLAGENVADSSPVRVNTFGVLDINDQTETIGQFTVAEVGGVLVGSSGSGRLTMASLTTSGAMHSVAGSQYVLNGNVTSMGFAGIDGQGSLALNGVTRVFNVGEPGELLLAVRVTGAAGVVKEGPGTLKLTMANDYTGGTVVLDGTLW
jgi:fibronectin-binding autotransporter adhesin